MVSSRVPSSSSKLPPRLRSSPRILHSKRFVSARRNDGVSEGVLGGKRGVGDKDRGDGNTLVLASFTLLASSSAIATVVAGSALVSSMQQRVQSSFSLLTSSFPDGPAGECGPRFLREGVNLLSSLERDYGSTFSVVVAGKKVVITSDRGIASSVLQGYDEEGGGYIKTGTAFLPSSESGQVGKGLLVSDGQLWRRQRRLAAPAFRRSAVRIYAEAVVEAVTNSVAAGMLGGENGEEERGAGVRDVYADVNEISLNAVSACLFGGDVKESGGRVRQIIARAFQSLGEVGVTAALPWIPSPATVKLNSAVRELDEVVYAIVRRRRRKRTLRRKAVEAERKKQGEKWDPMAMETEEDLLGALLSSFEAERESAVVSDADADKQLRDEVMHLLVAGQETSALTVGWTLALLAEHTELADLVAEEGKRVNDKNVAPADRMRHLHFTQACILEAMRLRPPAYIIGRCTSANTQLGSYNLPKGTTILVSPFLMHRRDQYWERANDFYPQRWMEQLAKEEEGKERSKMTEVLCTEALIGTYNEGAYIPFGGGPRTCIGGLFAMMETTLIVAELCRRYRFSLPAGQTKGPEPRAFITLRPEEDKIMLRIHRRE